MHNKMNELIENKNKNTGLMSSKEIAEITGKNHADVMRDIRSIAEDMHKANLLFVCNTISYISSNGQEYPMYELAKKSVQLLISGYSVPIRAKIIDRLEELESSQPKEESRELPKNFAEALRLLADEVDKNIQLEHRLEEAQPKVDFFNAVADSKDAIDIGQAAKVLNMRIGRNSLFEFLRERGVLMYNNSPYQVYIDRGYFRVVEQKYSKPDGSTHISIKTLVYQKGLDAIRKSLIENYKK